MHGYISVEVEQRNYVKLISLDRAGRGNRKLTTIEPRQNRALVKVYFETESGRQLLYEFDVGNIPPHPEKPDLCLQTDFDGKRSVYLSLFLNNRLYEEKQFDLRPYTNKTGKTVVIAAASLISTAALILLILWAAGVFSAAPGTPAQGTPAPGTPEGTAVPRGSAETSAGNDAMSETADDEKEKPSSAGSKENTSGSASGETAAESTTGHDDQSRSSKPNTRTAEEDTAAQPREEESGASPPAAKEAETRQQPGPSAAESRTTEQLALTETINFLPDDTRLTREAGRELDRIYRYLQEHPDALLTFTGHTALFGTERARSYISRERAENTKDYLIAKGWKPAEEPEIQGKGAEDPLTFDPDEQDKNRRVVISITVKE